MGQTQRIMRSGGDWRPVWRDDPDEHWAVGEAAPATGRDSGWRRLAGLVHLSALLSIFGFMSGGFD